MDRYYGVILQVPMLCAEFLAWFELPTKKMWLIRHGVTFGYFYISLIAFFLLIRRCLDSDWLGLLGVLLLVLTPRIFAEAFYNIKDIGFLASFIIALFFYRRFIEKRDVTSAVWLGAFYSSQDMPWHYIWVMMLVTIPASLGLFFLWSLATTVKAWLTKTFWYQRWDTNTILLLSSWIFLRL